MIRNTLKPCFNQDDTADIAIMNFNGGYFVLLLPKDVSYSDSFVLNLQPLFRNMIWPSFGQISPSKNN